MTNNKIHISMSTVSPDTINKINLLHRKHKNFLIVAPVFGRPETAAMRELWIFLSGDSVAKTRALPILKLLSKGTYDFGENISSASIIKLASNFLVASAIASIGESCAFLEKSGLDSKIFADMIVNTLFSCQVYRYHAGNIASKKFLPAEFKQTLGLKDINLILKFSKEKNIQMPIAEIIKNNLLFSIENNQEDLDWSAMTLKCFSCQEFSQQFSVN
jgi:3-hydroxyisobutyrate dehydrogenase-like beta-hydroxyacid dehydrogenase